MSFISSIFSNSNGSGFQAQGTNSTELDNQYAAGQNNLGAAAQGYNTLATQGSALAQSQLANANAQGVQQASGQVSSQKGLNPALAARLGNQTAGQMLNQGANQSAQLQAQTQMAGLSGLASTGSQQAGLANQQLSGQNTVNAGIAAGNQANQAKLFSGALNGAASAAAMYQGGAVKMADGGNVDLPMAQDNASLPPDPTGPQSVAGKFFNGFQQSMQAPQTGNNAPGSMSNSPIKSPGESSGGGGPSPLMMAALMAKGGKVPVILSPGEKKLDPKEAVKVAQGKESPLKAGQTIPGKAKVKGDSLKNDVYSTEAEEGSIIIPRSIMQSNDNDKVKAKKAAAFVAAHLSSKKHK